MLLVLVAVAVAPAQVVYDYYADFITSSNNSSNTWQYFTVDVTGSHNPASYTLQPNYSASMAGQSGLQGWFTSFTGTDQSQGFLGVNRSGAGIGGVPSGHGILHPGDTDAQTAVVGFKAPVSGLFNVSWAVENTDAGGGGVAWYLDKNATTLASGTRSFGAGLFSSSLSNVALNAGDFLYFIIAPNGTNFYDTTRLDFSITAVPEAGVCMLLATGGAIVGLHRRRTLRLVLPRQA